MCDNAALMPPHIDTSRHDTSASSLPAAFCLQSLLAARKEWGGGVEGAKGQVFPHSAPQLLGGR